MFNLKETWNVIAIDTLAREGMCKCFLPFSSNNEINIIWGLYADVHQTNLEFGKSKTTKYLFWLLGLTIQGDADNDARHDVEDVVCDEKKLVVLVGLTISQASH
jgi:hypothetical protein